MSSASGHLQRLGALRKRVAALMLRRRASTALLEVAEERFRRVFEDSPAGMVLADLDQRILDANPAFAAFLGRAVDEIVGRHVSEFTEPGDMEVNRRLHRRLLAGQTSHYTMEKRYVRKDGSLVWGELTVSLVRDDRGRPLSVHAQVQDITERRRAVEALDRRARHGEAAAALGRIALVASDIGELAQRTAEVVAERLGADSCSVTEVNGVELHTLAAVGEGTGRKPGERWTMRASGRPRMRAAAALAETMFSLRS